MRLLKWQCAIFLLPTVCIILIIKQQKTNSKSLSALDKDFCSFNKKQRKFNSYSEDYAVLFYIRLLHFSSRLLTEYFRLALKKWKQSLFNLYLLHYYYAFVYWHCIILLFYFWQLNYCQYFWGPYLFNFIFLLFTKISYSVIYMRIVTFRWSLKCRSHSNLIYRKYIYLIYITYHLSLNKSFM